MRRVISLFLAVVLMAGFFVPVSNAAFGSSTVEDAEILYFSELVPAWEYQFRLYYNSFSVALGGYTEDIFVADMWRVFNYFMSRIGIGNHDNLASLTRRVTGAVNLFEDAVDRCIGATLDTTFDELALKGLRYSVKRIFFDLNSANYSFAVQKTEAVNGYAFVDSMTGYPFCTSAGAVLCYIPVSDAPSTSEDGSGSLTLGGKWRTKDQVRKSSRVSLVSHDMLSELAYELSLVGNLECGLQEFEIDGQRYWVIMKQNYYIYCSPDSIPYGCRIETNYASDTEFNYITNTGDTIENQVIDQSTSTTWFPDGTLNYIDELIYDSSTHTYHIDAHKEYDFDNDTYNIYQYEIQFELNYTSVTYIGSTEEYDKHYEFYYELPDGRSSADLTAEDLEVLNVSLDMVPYVRSADDTSLRALYHFDGNTFDSSYWSHETQFIWEAGASITYMDANAFNGALYLDETEHDFTITFPGRGLGGDDFTLQFRYYQSHTETPTTDSFVQLGTQPILRMNGANFMTASGQVIASTSVGNWQEICIMRKSGTLYYYINGVKVYSESNSSWFSAYVRFYFGSDQQTYKYFDELRFVKSALYPTTRYTPTSVPHDTNLALVLPDAQRPVADAYWKFNADGNLLTNYDWSGSYAVDESVMVEVPLPQDTSMYKYGIDFTDAYVSHIGSWFIDEDGLGVEINSDSVTIWHNTELYLPIAWLGENSTGQHFCTSAGLSEDLDPGQQYTFSVMLADGAVHSVPFVMSAFRGDDLAESKEIIPGVFLEVMHSGVADLFDYDVLPILMATDKQFPVYLSIRTVNTSVQLVYVELVEGSAANSGHEYVESVAALDMSTITKSTLAVRTAHEITGYQLGGVRPSLPKTGLVWGLVESGRITSLQIYNGQAWEECDGRIWTGSRWVPYYAFDILLMKDLWDVVGNDPSMDPIYTETGFWSWLQRAWDGMIERFDIIIDLLRQIVGDEPEIDDTIPLYVPGDGETLYTPKAFPYAGEHIFYRLDGSPVRVDISTATPKGNRGSFGGGFFSFAVENDVVVKAHRLNITNVNPGQFGYHNKINLVDREELSVSCIDLKAHSSDSNPCWTYCWQLSYEAVKDFTIGENTIVVDTHKMAVISPGDLVPGMVIDYYCVDGSGDDVPEIIFINSAFSPTELTAPYEYVPEDGEMLYIPTDFPYAGTYVFYRMDGTAVKVNIPTSTPKGNRGSVGGGFFTMTVKNGAVTEAKRCNLTVSNSGQFLYHDEIYDLGHLVSGSVHCVFTEDLIAHSNSSNPCWSVCHGTDREYVYNIPDYADRLDVVNGRIIVDTRSGSIVSSDSLSVGLVIDFYRGSDIVFINSTFSPALSDDPGSSDTPGSSPSTPIDPDLDMNFPGGEDDPETEEDEKWNFIDLLVVIKDGVWSFTTGVITTAVDGVTGLASGMSHITDFFDAYSQDGDIMGIVNYEGEDIWD